MVPECQDDDTSGENDGCLGAAIPQRYLRYRFDKRYPIMRSHST